MSKSMFEIPRLFQKVIVHGGLLDFNMSTWRMAGLNYVNYSSIAARVLRRSLKSPLKDEAAKRDASHIRVFYWAEGQMLAAGEKPKGSGVPGGGGKDK